MLVPTSNNVNLKINHKWLGCVVAVALLCRRFTSHCDVEELLFLDVLGKAHVGLPVLLTNKQQVLGAERVDAAVFRRRLERSDEVDEGLVSSCLLPPHVQHQGLVAAYVHRLVYVMAYHSRCAQASLPHASAVQSLDDISHSNECAVTR